MPGKIPYQIEYKFTPPERLSLRERVVELKRRLGEAATLRKETREQRRHRQALQRAESRHDHTQYPKQRSGLARRQ